MNLAFWRQAPQPLRHVISTRTESAAVRRKREETTAALRRYVTEQRLLRAVAKAVQQ